MNKARLAGRWRPIRTAPKDRMIQLAWTDNGVEWSVLPGRWIDVHHRNYVTDCIVHGLKVHPVVEGHWQCSYLAILQHGNGSRQETSYGEASSIVFHPVYWQPLAAPPKRAARTVRAWEPVAKKKGRTR